MKRSLLLLVSIGFILTGAKAQGQEWVLIPQEKEKNFELLVDKLSIKQLPESIVSARIRFEYKKPYYGDRAYDCRKCSHVKEISHTIILEEFDCKAKKLRMLELTEYYVDKTPYTEIGAEAWKQPLPKGIDEILINYICTQRKE
jgi:hypothetical protein